MNAERYAQGIALDEYVQGTTGRRRFLSKLAEISLPDEVTEFFRNLPAPLHAIVITEPWCPGAPMALSMLVHCATLSDGRLDGRVLARDANPDVMDEYLKAGKYRSITVVGFLTADFTRLGDIRENPTLPAWAALDIEQRRLAEVQTPWSELWGRAYMIAVRG